MVVYLDETVFDQIKSDGVFTDLSGKKYVIAHRGHDKSESTTDPKLNIGLAINELDVRCAGFVVTDNIGGTDGEDSTELAAERFDSLEDAIHAMVNGTEGKTEVTFYTELCADYGNAAIIGLARWAHPSRFADGARWF